MFEDLTPLGIDVSLILTKKYRKCENKKNCENLKSIIIFFCLDVTLNSQLIKPQEDLSYRIGECLQLGVTIHNYLEKPLKKVALILQCYQDYRNGNTNYRVETRLAYSGADKVLIPLVSQIYLIT